MKPHNLLIIAFCAFLGASYYLGYTPIALSVVYLFAGLITYALYAKDKAAAREGSWRVSEKSLHLAALVFGWPGALIAQERLRHKTKKRSFRAVFWLSVIVNLCVVGWLHSPKGNMQFREAAHQIDDFTISNISYKTPASIVLLLTSFRSVNDNWSQK